MYPRSESNRDRQNRNLKFYPLNYRGKGTANIRLFAKPAKINSYLHQWSSQSK